MTERVDNCGSPGKSSLYFVVETYSRIVILLEQIEEREEKVGQYIEHC